MTTPRSHSRSILHVLLAMIVSLAPGCASTPHATPTTTIIVVRHAEKETTGTDPALTEQGKARAQRLAEICAANAVSAVYSTPYNRTRQTAEPTATRLGLAVNTDFGPRSETALAEYIKAHNAGQAVLVVGHSNTVPKIIAALGAAAIPDLSEKSYDRLFTVTLRADGTAALDERRYGTPTPEGR